MSINIIIIFINTQWTNYSLGSHIVRYCSICPDRYTWSHDKNQLSRVRSAENADCLFSNISTNVVHIHNASQSVVIPLSYCSKRKRRRNYGKESIVSPYDGKTTVERKGHIHQKRHLPETKHCFQNNRKTRETKKSIMYKLAKSSKIVENVPT